MILIPAGVAPFPGATTGAGGRMRDVQSTGRGAHVIAGTAGYCFGNLHIPGKNTVVGLLYASEDSSFSDAKFSFLISKWRCFFYL